MQNIAKINATKVKAYQGYYQSKISMSNAKTFSKMNIKTFLFDIPAPLDAVLSANGKKITNLQPKNPPPFLSTKTIQYVGKN